MQEMIPSDLLWVRYMGTFPGTLQRNFIILRRAQTHRALRNRRRLSSQTRTPLSGVHSDLFELAEPTTLWISEGLSEDIQDEDAYSYLYCK